MPHKKIRTILVDFLGENGFDVYGRLNQKGVEADEQFRK